VDLEERVPPEHPLRPVRLIVNATLADLWPLFAGLSHVPLFLAWGEASNILLPETVARMRQARPDMHVVSLPGIGHAPILTEPPVVAALARFLAQVG
jgi:pimeloyl-ACP methyl ester carboxylesterase